MVPFNIIDATHNYNKVCNRGGATDNLNCKSTFLVALRYQTGDEYLAGGLVKSSFRGVSFYPKILKSSVRMI